MRTGTYFNCPWLTGFLLHPHIGMKNRMEAEHSVSMRFCFTDGHNSDLRLLVRQV